MTAAKMAMAYRAKFRKDVFINFICYRRYGHNELDDPSFTQPLMYNIIKEKGCLVDKYQNKLKQEGLCSSEVVSCIDEFIKCLEDELNAVDANTTKPMYLI